MSVSLRLARHGSKKRPFYRIVAADSSKPRDGRFLEIVGTYSPIKENIEVTVNKERALYWINNGARVSDTVKTLLVKQGVI